MTRAADRLIVCGADGERKRPDGCWYDLVRERSIRFWSRRATATEKVLRYRKTPAAMRRQPRAPAADARKNPSRRELPSWLRQTAPVRSAARRTAVAVVGFRRGDRPRRAPAPAAAADRQKALQRGRIVHRLMQSLPDIPPARRKDALERYLAGAARDFSAAEQAEIARQVFAILDDRKFAEVFAPAAAPKCRSSAALRAPAASRSRRRTGGPADRHRRCRPDRRLQDRQRSCRAGSTRCRRPMSRSLHFTARCWRGFIPDKTVRAALIFHQRTAC